MKERKQEEYEVLQQETSFIMGGIDDMERIVIEKKADNIHVQEVGSNPFY